MKIALDAMGGDFGPPNLVAGAVMALRDYHAVLLNSNSYWSDQAASRVGQAARPARIQAGVI